MQERIEKHNHYSNCLIGYEYNQFDSKRNDLNKCKNCYNNIKNFETEIVKLCCDKKIVEQELNNLKTTIEKDLEIVKQKLELVEQINMKENEITLNDYKNRYQNDDLKNYYELIQLDKELSNLDKEIKEIKENLDNELNLKKKKNYLNYQMNIK